MTYGRVKRGPMAADVLGDHFTQIFNKAARDRRISRKARGLLLEIATHRDGFGISVASLVAAGPEGKDSVTAGLKELEKYGYLHRYRTRDESGHLGESVFEITDMPDGLSLTAPAPWEEQNENPRSEPVTGNPPQGTRNENPRSEPMAENPAQAKPQQVFPLHKKNNNYKNNNYGEDQAAPSARSAGDGRRPTAGSSAREEHSGSAASGGAEAPKRSSSPKSTRRPRLTRDQSEAIRAIEAAYPPELAALLPKYRPDVIRDTSLDALDSRTPEQVADRVARRWHTHGYADALHSADGAGLKRPVGVAAALIRPSTDCPDPMCEDGTIIDTGAPCRTCAARREERRTRPGARGTPTIPAPARPETRECADCRRPVTGTEVPADGVCRECHAAAAAAFARLGEDLAATTN